MIKKWSGGHTILSLSLSCRRINTVFGELRTPALQAEISCQHVFSITKDFFSTPTQEMLLRIRGAVMRHRDHIDISHPPSMVLSTHWGQQHQPNHRLLNSGPVWSSRAFFDRYHKDGERNKIEGREGSSSSTMKGGNWTFFFSFELSSERPKMMQCAEWMSHLRGREGVCVREREIMAHTALC